MSSTPICEKKKTNLPHKTKIRRERDNAVRSPIDPKVLNAVHRQGRGLLAALKAIPFDLSTLFEENLEEPETSADNFMEDPYQ